MNKIVKAVALLVIACAALLLTRHVYIGLTGLCRNANGDNVPCYADMYSLLYTGSPLVFVAGLAYGFYKIQKMPATKIILIPRRR